MCGIFGYFNLLGNPVDPAFLEPMARRLAHRGPDGHGTYHTRQLAFGAGRLAIIDLSAPAGPIMNEDRHVGVVFNGEIYNYKVPRVELERLGHQFATKTDTEVIVHGYEAWGRDVIQRLHGMFALCIWDEPEQRLVLARDRAGEKPLYFTRIGDEFIFASEIKAFLDHPLFKPSVNHEALLNYLALGYVPAPQTMFAGVEKLFPGEQITVNRDGIAYHRYWRPTMNPLKPVTNIVCRTAGAATGAVWVVEDGNVTDMSITDAGRETMNSYLTHFHKLDLWQANVTRMPRDQVFLGCEHTSENELLKTEFYNDFARPFGLFRPLGAMVQLRPGAVATISLERLNAKNLFDVEDKPIFQRFIPYVKSALQLRLRERENSQRARLYASALDALTFGAVICNARADIVFSNPAAEALAVSGAGVILGRRGRGIGAIVPVEARTLTALVSTTANGGPGGVLRLTGQDGGTSLLVLVTPLPRKLGGDTIFGYALVSLRSARDRPAFIEATLTALFRLSPTQAQIAIALHGGKTPEEIALERGVKISTLRTHLAEIFARTGTENQRDLIRLLGLLPPLAR